VPQTIAIALRELVHDGVIEKLDTGRYRRIVLGPDDASLEGWDRAQLPLFESH